MTTYALIIANPNSNQFGNVISTHHTIKGAGRAYGKLDYARWAYVAERRADGSYPHRIEALDLDAHISAMHHTSAR